MQQAPCVLGRLVQRAALRFDRATVKLAKHLQCLTKETDPVVSAERVSGFDARR